MAGTSGFGGSRRGSTEQLRFPILVSFNELAWIAVFGLALLYTYKTLDAQKIEKELIELKAAQKKGDVAGALAAKSKREIGLRKELLGLRGDMKNVVFVVDCSGSMKPNWQRTKDVVLKWIENLDIERATLIMFNAYNPKYPGQHFGTKAIKSLEVNDKSPAAEANRTKLKKAFSQTAPAGNTDTLAALKRAYNIPGIDTIILFTDGAPDLHNNNFYDSGMAGQIKQLVHERSSGKRKIRVHTIGLGGFDWAYNSQGNPVVQSQTTELLRYIADASGGTFMAR
jgi:hypothetical protein